MSRLFNLEASPFFPKSVLDLYQRKRFESMPMLLHNQKNYIWNILFDNKLYNFKLIEYVKIFTDDSDRPIANRAEVSGITEIQSLESQKDSDFEFQCKNGCIQLSHLPLLRTDFHRCQIEGHD